MINPKLRPETHWLQERREERSPHLADPASAENKSSRGNDMHSMPDSLADFNPSECGVALEDLPRFPDGSIMWPARKWFCMRPTFDSQVRYCLSADFVVDRKRISAKKPTAVAIRFQSVIDHLTAEIREVAKYAAKLGGRS